MAKKHSDDSTSNAPETHGSLGANGLASADMDLAGMDENMISESGYHPASTGQPGSLSSSPSPTSMAKKKGNQPR